MAARGAAVDRSRTVAGGEAACEDARPGRLDSYPVTDSSGDNRRQGHFGERENKNRGGPTARQYEVESELRSSGAGFARQRCTSEESHAR